MASPLQQELVLDDFDQGIRGEVRESFELSGHSVCRTVRQRNGRQSVSRVPLQIDGAASSWPARDIFDRSWLRMAEAPPFEECSRVLTIADLFSGCGGLSLGVREACRALGVGARFAYASDLNSDALDVYQKNFHPAASVSVLIETQVDGKFGTRPTPTERELRQVVGDVDFVLAGPPCQGHSDLNNHSRRSDPRNELILRVVRFVELFKPRYVLIENVQGIRHDRNGALGAAKNELNALGYSIAEGVISADAVGVAQTRKRYFLFAGLERAYDFNGILKPWSKQPRSLNWAIGDLIGVKSTETFDSSASHSVDNRRRIDHLFDHDLHELPDSERPPCHSGGGHSYKSVYGRMHWEQPAPTITTGFGSTGQGRFVHPIERRTLTPHEAARVQFFPDFFDFGIRGRRQYQALIGNAVPSKLAYAIALHQLG
jgi:DNA (cytosine-5)-methyltransferase 1